MTEETQASQHETPEATAATKVKVMLLGAGELGRELVIAFQRLGARVIAVDEHADAPALPIADESVVATITDTEELTALIGRLQPQYVVAETNTVAVDALTAVLGASRMVACVISSLQSQRATVCESPKRNRDSP